MQEYVLGKMERANLIKNEKHLDHIERIKK